MERWVGRVALVTGASAGFGEALSKRLVKHGMKVVGCARNFDKLKELEASLKNEKGSFLPIQCDVTKEEEILAMFAKIKKELGGVDVCVNNAGLSHNAPLLTGKTEDWKNMLEVNILGLAICTREAFKSMEERNVDDGHIVLLGSMSGHRVIKDPSLHMYAATKYAVKALTEGLRNELVAKKSHIRVTAISPGLAKTEITHRMFKDDPELADQRLQTMTALTADDVVDSIIYALSAPPHVEVYDILVRPTDCIN